MNAFLRSSHPLVVEVRRGATIESEHLVDVVLSDETGTVLAQWGDPTRLVLPRSAMKLIQALPLITTGAADAFALSEQELALATASHSAEPDHLEVVQAWLARLGLTEADLECGPDRPLGEQQQRAFEQAGSTPSKLVNCCSGKHAGYLSIARHLDVDPAGYTRLDHPVQQLITAAIETATGQPADTSMAGIDGCSVPTFAVSLEAMATAIARFGAGQLDGAARLTAALLAETSPSPAWLMSGTGRAEVQIHELAAEALITKVGAEGVFVAALPDRGWGLALKARDGAVRAADIAMADTLYGLGAVRTLPLDRKILSKADELSGAYRVRWPTAN